MTRGSYCFRCELPTPRHAGDCPLRADASASSFVAALRRGGGRIVEGSENERRWRTETDKINEARRAEVNRSLEGTGLHVGKRGAR